MKHTLIVLALLISVTVRAQLNTDTIKLPFAVAKQIAIELVKYDSTKSLLSITQVELELSRELLVYKDSMLTNATINIVGLSRQLANQQQQTEAYKQLYTTKKEDYNTLSDKFRKHKALRNFIDITAFVAVGFVIYLIAK